jgi:ornithine cyclodeaminase/alanine dehydrogenase-like protein (mu-crystallin family)
MLTSDPFTLTDRDLEGLLSPTEAVALMESFILARAQGLAYGPPRLTAPLGPDKNLVFTAGGGGEVLGFRAYLTGPFAHNEQVVAVWEAATGALRGLIVGELLGAWRTGALGAVAVKHLARHEAVSLAIIGSGRQAYTQLMCILSARLALQEVRVYSRTPDHAEQFCADILQLRPRLNIYTSPSAEAAVRGADVIVTATTSREPVLLGEWLKPGAHLNIVGPKGRAACEVDMRALERADFIATDSPEQLGAYPGGAVSENLGPGGVVYDLAAVLSGQAGRPSETAITVFLSMGLAGTEVALGARLLQKAAAAPSADG